MKFCSKCGRQNADGASICQFCGTPFAMPGVHGSHQWADPAFGQQGYGAGRRVGGALIQTTKKALSSPLALTAIILFTLTTVLSIFAPSGLDNLMNSIASFGSGIGLSSGDMRAFNEMRAAVFGTNLFVKFIGALPALLVILGMWITFAAATSKQRGAMSTAGLTLIKVITIFQLVLVCIGFALLEIFMFIILVASEETIVLIPIFAIAIVFTLAILYYVMAVKTENVLKRAVSVGQIDKPVSVYLAVMLIIGGTYTLGSFVIFHLLTHAYNIINILQTLSSAGASVLFGAFLFSCRGTMRAAQAGTGAVPVGAPQMQNNQQMYNAPNMPQYGSPQPQVPNQAQGSTWNQPTGNQNIDYGATTVLSPSDLPPQYNDNNGETRY